MLRRSARVLAVLVAVLLLPAAAAAIAAPAAFDARYPAGPQWVVPATGTIPHDPTKPTAVVVVGNRGAVVSDVLAPYEVLAATGRFNVYTVAPQRRPVTLTGGLDLVPDLSFDDLVARLGPAAPQLVVVPALPDVGEPSTAPVIDWLRTQAARGARLLSVCNGSGVLASAGLLDGRPATAHWLRIRSYAADYPAVHWVRGQRYVDDGDVVTTAGILSGIDGTLHLVERLAGAAVAVDAAAAIGWLHYRGDPPVATGLAAPDVVAVVNAGYRWDPQRVGVLLTDGVGEIELASVFDTYGGQSLAARTLALTTDGTPIRSRHGLTFLPRADLATAHGLDRLIVPGAARDVPARPGGPAPVFVHDRPGFAFDAVLADLAASTDIATARWTAKVLELPANGIALEGRAWPWIPTTVPMALALLGAAALTAIRHLRTSSRSAPIAHDRDDVPAGG